MAVSRERKQEKYKDLVEALRGAGYRATLIPLEVISRGMLSVKDLAAISEALCPSKEELSTLCVQVIRASILGSFRHHWYLAIIALCAPGIVSPVGTDGRPPAHMGWSKNRERDI